MQWHRLVKKMRKYFSVLMVVAMLFTMYPGLVYADTDLPGNNTQQTEDITQNSSETLNDTATQDEDTGQGEEEELGEESPDQDPAPGEDEEVNEEEPSSQDPAQGEDEELSEESPSQDPGQSEDEELNEEEPPNPSSNVVVESLAVMEEADDALKSADIIIAGTAYSVQIQLKNPAETESTSLTVALYGMKNEPPTSIGEPQSVDSLSAGGEITLNFSWTPGEVGDFTLEAVVTDSVGTQLNYQELVVTVAEAEEKVEIAPQRAVDNHVPRLKSTVSTPTDVQVQVYTAYTLDLSDLFEDEDDDPLTYMVSVNGCSAVAADEDYSYTPAELGQTILVFNAHDGYEASSDTHTVNLTTNIGTNTRPVLKTGVSATETANLNLGDAYTFDLRSIFEDADNDLLTYTVSIDGADPVTADQNYSYTPSGTGEIVLVFTAKDYEVDGAVYPTYTVTLTISSGSGIAYNGQSETGSYTISTADQLALLAEKVNAGTKYTGSTFTLTNNIDLSAVCGEDINGSTVSWTPIGNSLLRYFGGTFDGNGKTVSGLYINTATNYQGLFACLNKATVKNLTVSGSIITSSVTIGGISGYSNGAAIINCRSDVAITVNASGRRVGGIAGYTLGNGTITSCVNTGTITCSSTSSDTGAIVGYNTSTEITACYSTTDAATSTSNSINGTIVTADELKTPRVLWGLNTANGTQPYSGVWTADDNGIYFGTGVVYYRIGVMNHSPSVILTFTQEGATIASYAESGDYTTVYVPEGTLTISPSTMTNFLFDPNPALIKDENSYILTVSSDTELSCGLESDYLTDSEKLQKVTWYTDDPSAVGFTISSADQLVGLELLVSGDITGYDPVNFSGKTITLGGDIDLSAVCGPALGQGDSPVNWIPIGTEEHSFSGTFDGAGHSVNNLYINSSADDQGLFGYVNGTVSNVVVSGTVTGGSNVGAIAGTCTGTIINCTSLADVSGSSNTGGVAGTVASISTCIYYQSGADIGVAGNASSAAGCYYLADQDIAGAVGEAKNAEEFAAREIAYLLDTAAGSHTHTWQPGGNYPVLGSNTVYKVFLKPEIIQSGKSVGLAPSSIDIYTDGAAQYAYLVSGETFNLNVTNDDLSYVLVFYPSDAVVLSEGVYTLSISSADISLSYRFYQSVAADKSWYDEIRTEFTLTTEAQLRGLAALVNDDAVSFEGKTINLGNDITIAGDDWTMIGNKTNQFFGTFDGQNHTVSGFFIKITGTDANIYNYQGFFGYLGNMSTVRNLKLDGIVADGKCFCGILAGYADPYCTISNCVTNGTVSFTDNTKSTIYAAGMVGNLGEYGIMNDCINNAAVIVNLDTPKVSSTNFGTAGLIGYLDPYGEVRSCINNGPVSCSMANSNSLRMAPMVGGIIGNADKEIKVSDCVNNGAITGSGIITGSGNQISIGGVIGSSYTAVVSGCQNQGRISCSLADSLSRAFAGGIIGGSNGGLTALANTKYDLTLDKCSNNGAVEIQCQDASNYAFAGGIAGGSGIMLTAIENCNNTGAVNVTCPSGAIVTGTNATSGGTTTGAGGIIGNAYNMNTDAQISKCVNSGTVSASANYVGGITGNAAAGLLITDCYNLAPVTGADYVGGIAGNLACSLQSAFNYGGSIIATSGSNAGRVVGSGATAVNAKAAYYLDTTGLAGTENAADAACTTAKTAEEFASSFDLVYALNSAGGTVNDRGVWEAGEDYPEFALEGTEPVFEVKAVSGANGTVSRSEQYLYEGETYTITFTPANGYILQYFTVTDNNGNSYTIYFNSIENDIYFVTMEDTEGQTYAASFSQNVLTCTMATHSLTFTGEFIAAPTGTATVTLNGNGGWFDNDENKTSAALSVNSGVRLTREDLPQPEEYRIFVGWYSDEEGTVPYNFSAAVTADTTIYAKWNENSCVVFYNFNGGSWSAKNYTPVTIGSCLAEPVEIPAKTGCTFTGWYSDEACLHPFDFANTVITSNITLYAGWISAGNYQVIFDANGGTFADSAIRIPLAFPTGTAIGSALDAHPVSNGELILRGWYSAATGGSKWLLSNTLSGDLILYAHWDAANGTPTIYTGTEEAPMEIEDLEQLLTLRNAVNAGNSYEGGYFKMVNNLTLPADWVPIGALKPGAANGGQGKNINPFSGIFDGGGNTITVPENGLPLFGYVREAIVQNLNIYGVKIAGCGLINNYDVDYGTDGDYNSGTGGSYVAGCPDTVLIDNVTLKSGSSTLYSGFIAGYASGANIVTIRNSTVESGVVIGYEKSSSGLGSGSFAGHFNGTVENCVSYATVYGEDYVGGIIAGKGQSMGPCQATNCIFAGTIESTGNYVGGIIAGGYYSPSAPNSPCVSVQNCYVTGNITGSDYVGGILGAEPAVTQCWANGAGYIQNNYCSGTITATAANATAGGIIGFMKSLDRYNIIENNYYLSNTSDLTGIGAIEAIDYTSSSYSRSKTFVANEVCIPTSTEEFASGKIAALLNQGNNSSRAWTQAGAYPVWGNTATATYTATLNITGSGTASLTGLTTDTAAVYQNAGSMVSVSAIPAQGSKLAQINVYADSTTANITSSKAFTMPQQDAEVYVVFAEEGEKYVESIAVANRPAKISYSIGDSFDINGLTFTVNYSDGSQEIISATADMVSGFSSDSAGTKTLTLTYLGSVTQFTVEVVSGGGGPSEPDTITVYFTLLGTEADGENGTVNTLRKGNLTTWIPRQSVTVTSGSNVGDVFKKVLDASGYSYVGLNNNYIRSITTPDDLTLAEFTNGPDSGWMYTLNGTHPLYGLNQQEVENGDEIVWHYTDNYHQEEGSEEWGGGSSATTNSNPVSTTISATLDSQHVANVTISGEALSKFVEAITKAEDKPGNAAAIKVDTPQGATGVTTTLPPEVVKALQKTENTGLNITTGLGSMNLDAQALQTIVKAAGDKDATVSINQVTASNLNEEQRELVGEHPVYDLAITAGGTQITSFGGGKIEVTIPYILKEGESAENLTVYYLGENGEVKEMTGAKYDAELNAIVFTTDHFSKFAVVYEVTKEAEQEEEHIKFSDVSGWAEEYIYYLAEHGIISGKTETTFAPNDNITRAEFAALLARMSGANLSQYTLSNFSDVKSSDWYCSAVTWANQQKVAQGYAGQFNPNEPITRQDMAVMINNYSQAVNYSLPQKNQAIVFADDTEIADYAKDAVTALQQAEIISGQGNHQFAPVHNATRAEAAKMLAVFLQGIKK